MNTGWGNWTRSWCSKEIRWGSGARSRPPDFARDLTIVTVGGSTTECFDLAEDKTWPHDLGVKLQRDFKHLWLNNAGLSGNSTFGHAILMQDYLVKLKPKVVIFLVGINDLGSGANGISTRGFTGLTFAPWSASWLPRRCTANWPRRP